MLNRLLKNIIMSVWILHTVKLCRCVANVSLKEDIFSNSSSKLHFIFSLQICIIVRKQRFYPIFSCSECCTHYFIFFFPLFVLLSFILFYFQTTLLFFLSQHHLIVHSFTTSLQRFSPRFSPNLTNPSFMHIFSLSLKPSQQYKRRHFTFFSFSQGLTRVWQNLTFSVFLPEPQNSTTEQHKTFLHLLLFLSQSKAFHIFSNFLSKPHYITTKIFSTFFLHSHYITTKRF